MTAAEEAVEAARGRRTTAGEVIADDYSINYAHMVFSTNVCWYLDNTFCVMFHSLLAAGMDATLILQVVVFFVNALGFIYVAAARAAEAKAKAGAAQAHHLPAMLRLRNRWKGNNGSSKSTG